MADSTGLEPATSAVTVRRSNQNWATNPCTWTYIYLSPLLLMQREYIKIFLYCKFFFTKKQKKWPLLIKITFKYYLRYLLEEKNPLSHQIQIKVSISINKIVFEKLNTYRCPKILFKLFNNIVNNIRLNINANNE